MSTVLQNKLYSKVPCFGIKSYVVWKMLKNSVIIKLFIYNNSAYYYCKLIILEKIDGQLSNSIFEIFSRYIKKEAITVK